MNEMIPSIARLNEKAREIRSMILEMIVAANKGHIGGALSCTDILVALYYGRVLRVDPDNPRWDKRDRFILSKGHSGSALFAVLADLGFFEKGALETYCKNGTLLGGHPDRRIPGIEADTGSLGHGLGLGAGMALSAKMNKESHRVVVLVGDGECCEGSVWESLAFASRHKLDNLTLIVDRNRQCVLDFTEDCSPLDPLVLRLEAFGWDTREVNGHSFEELLEVLAGGSLRTSTKPFAIVANTIKGKVVSFMEGRLKWHHSVPSGEELVQARKELST
ncbi:MAG: transketolase [Deltaproteobacteria bacterium RBG_13_53_10]|nr:MAG: transketolase [Deltaproteobacteria bacterium RBG_13_53_10]